MDHFERQITAADEQARKAPPPLDAFLGLIAQLQRAWLDRRREEARCADHGGAPTV